MADNAFNVVYYPNADCHSWVLAKGILVFDEITFFDHPSLTFERHGTVGHESRMRHTAHILQPEGYTINVVEPFSGQVGGEIEKIIDADLGNDRFRETFLKLVHNDPSFLVSMIPEGNYGSYGDANGLRKAILSVKESEIPHTVGEMKAFDPTAAGGITPEILTASSMAMDSFKFNLASFIATEHNVNLFGDSRGMSMLLEAKFGSAAESSSSSSVSHQMAYTLMDRIVPNKAFQGKTIADVVRFRHSMTDERERFKERILEMTVELEGLDPKAQKHQFDIVLYKHLLPEARDYQERFANNWDKFFKDSTKAVALDAKGVSELIVTVLPVSIPAALLTATAYVGSKVLPFFIDYLKDKEALKRSNPYAYLMNFK